MADPSLVVSSGKDGRTVVTNIKTGEVQLEFPTKSNYQKIAWSQHNHGKVAAMNEEGTTDILSYTPQCTQAVGSKIEQEVEFATPQVQSSGQTYAPKWYHPRCGARFGFGGKLVTFNGKCLKIHSQVTHQKERDVAA